MAGRLNLAVGIRYTIFSPKDLPENAIGELWAVFFNGETDRHAVAKQEYRLTDSAASRSSTAVLSASLLPAHHLNEDSGSAK
jgi:hypothetical protein